MTERDRLVEKLQEAREEGIIHSWDFKASSQNPDGVLLLYYFQPPSLGMKVITCAGKGEKECLVKAVQKVGALRRAAVAEARMGET